MNNFWENNVESGYYDKILLDGLKRNRGLQTAWHDLTFKKVKSLLSDEEKHLDYACGPGTFIGNYINNDSVGVDISENQIIFAKKKYGNKGKFYTLEQFKIENYNNYFEVITIIGLFEFINDNEIIDLINELLISLKSKGEIIITTPNYGGAMRYIEKAVSRFGKLNYEYQHVNRFNKKRLLEILKKTNVDSMEISVKKIINFGINLSFINRKLGEKLESFFEMIFFNFFGYILLAKIRKL